MKKTFIIFCLFFGASVCFAPPSLAAATKTVPKKPVKIFYYTEGQKSLASFKTHYKYVDVIAPQTYKVMANGDLKGSINPELLKLAKLHKTKVMPLITNESFSQSAAAAFLNSPAAEDKAVAALVKEGIKNKYWGWQIDFEQIDVSYRDQFSEFTKRLHEALKKEKMILSVAVVSQVSQNPDDYKPNLWKNLIGVYDFSALAKNSDFISLMSYDDPGSKGPIARYAWLQDVTKYALKFIPKEKLSLGIPLYYWKWNDNTQKLVGIGGYAGIQNALATKNAVYHYSTVEEAPYLTYTASKVHYSVWYENDKSIAKKMALIKQFGLNGFSAWAIGLESPRIYLSL